MASTRTTSDTFRESYLQSDAKKLLLAYKIGAMLSGAMDRLIDRAPSRLQDPIGKARNLIWALLIQGTFNDPQLPKLMERYGCTLSPETEFREYLQVMAERRLLGILNQVLADDSYSDRIGGGKYGFLRSREIYARTIQVANREYGWVKKGV